LTVKAAIHNPIGETVAKHPDAVRLGRIGWFAKGVVYVLAGALALLVMARSLGWVGGATNAAKEASPTGAIKEIARSGGGPLVLYALAFGMFIYALWRLVTALLPGSTDAKGWATRAGYVVSAIIYTGLGSTAISLARSPGTKASTDGNKTVTDATARLMQHTAGRWMIGLAGAIAIGAGLYHIIQGVQGGATKDVEMSGMPASRARWTRRFGAAGEIGRGLAIGLIGFFLLRAAITFNAAEATGLDGALRRVVVGKGGAALVAVVGVGLVAYGVFCVTTFSRQRMHAP